MARQVAWRAAAGSPLRRLETGINTAVGEPIVGLGDRERLLAHLTMWLSWRPHMVTLDLVDRPAFWAWVERARYCGSQGTRSSSGIRHNETNVSTLGAARIQSSLPCGSRATVFEYRDLIKIMAPKATKKDPKHDTHSGSVGSLLPR